ncbi:hypothetical protein [Luteimonas sp. A501]
MKIFATDLRGSGRIYADRAERAEKTFCHGFARMNADRAESALSGFDSGGLALTRRPSGFIPATLCSIRVYPRQSVAKNSSCSIRVHPRKSAAKNSTCPIRVNPRPIRVNPWQKNCEVSR